MGLCGGYPGQTQTTDRWLLLGFHVHAGKRNVPERLAANAVQVPWRIYVTYLTQTFSINESQGR